MLFRSTLIKLVAQDIGIINIQVVDSGIKLKFNEQPNINHVKLIEMIQIQSSLYHFDGKQTFRILESFDNVEDRVKQIYQVINTLCFKL